MHQHEADAEPFFACFAWVMRIVTANGGKLILSSGFFLSAWRCSSR